MANPFLLFAAQTHRIPATEGESFVPGSKLDANNATGVNARTYEANEVALPSGITSMEHWLDLNA
jgi:hypothetical protein